MQTRCNKEDRHALCKAVLNSGLEKIPEFISEKGDFGDSSYRYVRQDENHKCGNQHFQDFAAVCQLHDPACQSHKEEQPRQQIRQHRRIRMSRVVPLRSLQQQIVPRLLVLRLHRPALIRPVVDVPLRQKR